MSYEITDAPDGNMDILPRSKAITQDGRVVVIVINQHDWRECLRRADAIAYMLEHEEPEP